MNYVNYNSSIVLRLGVQIVGWIGPIQNPKEIDDEDLLRSLRDNWTTGECRWEALTPEERANLVTQAKAGNIVKKPRKIRADKGTKRGKAIGAGDAGGSEVRTRKVRSDAGVKRKTPPVDVAPN